MGIFTIAPLPSEVSSNVISRMCRLLIFTLCKNHNSPCHSSWQPLLGSCLCQPCAEHLSLIDLAFGIMRVLLRGWILSIGWLGRLTIRPLWFPSRLQGWIGVRVRISSFLLGWYLVALQCYARFRCGASTVAQRVKNLPAMQKTRVWSLVWEDPRRRK